MLTSANGAGSAAAAGGGGSGTWIGAPEPGDEARRKFSQGLSALRHANTEQSLIYDLSVFLFSLVTWQVPRRSQGGLRG